MVERCDMSSLPGFFMPPCFLELSFVNLLINPKNLNHEKTIFCVFYAITNE